LKDYLSCILFLFCIALNAQKKVYKNFLADHIELIQVDATNSFLVEVETSESSEIVIETQMEGEYSQDLGLEVIIDGNTLLVESGFTPNFENPNDKLSAHKVVSISVLMKIPLHKKLEIFGTNSRVVVGGEFEEIDISLSDGACVLIDVIADITVKSQSGNIKVMSKAAKITAISKYGTISSNPIPLGTSIYKLQTVTGNIDFSKTE